MKSRVFFKESIRYIKPKNKYGSFKKFLLSIMPFPVIRFFFHTISISTNLNALHPQLILPWNQDFENKFVIFNLKEPPTLIKIGFKDAKKLISNEYNMLQNISIKNHTIAPFVLNYEEINNYSLIETTFYHGEHPNYLPNCIRDFFVSIYQDSEVVIFSDHPYIKRMISFLHDNLDEKHYKHILNHISYYVEKFSDINIPICLMHGDCTKTNVIIDNQNTKLIDWEECKLDGIPIDIRYFDFRSKFDKHQEWKIKDEIDFLVVVHYIYFQRLYSQGKVLRYISWNQDTVIFKK